MTEEDRNQPSSRKPLAPETKVFSRLDGEPGTILYCVGPDAYEVMTDQGIEVWQEQDIQPVEEADFAISQNPQNTQ